jgi:MFS family permease
LRSVLRFRTTGRIDGTTAFWLITGGQLVSLFGSGLTSFGLGVWVYQQTGSVLQFGLIAFSSALPALALSPFAGALVDRLDRRWILVASDASAGLTTLVFLFLARADALSAWHVYALNAVASAASAFHVPAIQATTTLLVPKRHLARAAGVVQSGTAALQTLVPVTAGSLLPRAGLEGILVIDLATFAVAVGTLLAVPIPRPARSAVGEGAHGSLRSEAVFGWLYLRARPGLLSLLLLLAGFNFVSGCVQVVLTPLVLSFTSPTVLGRVLSVGICGTIFGGLTLAAWGGPKRRIQGLVALLALGAALLALGGLRPSAVLIAGVAFAFYFIHPICTGLSQAIWQTKVEPDVQGRVFAFRRLVAVGTTPLAYLVAGPLADHGFEPLMKADGPLAWSIGRLLGVGPGRGVALMLMLLSFLLLLYLAVCWRNPRLRNLDTEIPDALADPNALKPRQHAG